jgi:PAT family acetyl-CoA transporter-like MFS transporter 1
MKRRKPGITNPEGKIMTSRKSHPAHYLIPRGGSSKESPKGKSRYSRITGFVARARDTTVEKVQVTLNSFTSSPPSPPSLPLEDHLQPTEPHSDRWNYALLIVLYTLQGIPMGLSASIPFLLQEKISKLASMSAAAEGVSAATAVGGIAASASASAAASYNANAIFALCSWPFSLKLLWAPIVDACYIPRWGRRKTWLVPVQTMAGLLLVAGAKFVQEQFAFNPASVGSSTTMDVRGLTMYFLVLYFLMATQDIAVDGWALTLLQKKNRGKGPICNSIGQNIGYFLSFVGFLALNDAQASESFWRPLLLLPRGGPRADQGIVSLQGFLTFMGASMLVVTWGVAIFKREEPPSRGITVNEAVVHASKPSSPPMLLFSGSEDTTAGNSIAIEESDDEEEDAELDASQIGLRETYHRLWAVCQLPSVRWLFLLLVTYRLPTALSDNVKFLKAVQLGMSKSTTALLSPLLILPLGIVVPLAAHRIWHKAPLQQFATAYIWRVTLVPLLDILMLKMLKEGTTSISAIRYWVTIVASTAAQAICNSLQFNAQMTFFAHRVDPLIGGSYMTLLNTAANLGGTWPASFVMGLLSVLSKRSNGVDGMMDNSRDPYFGLQALFSVLGIIWMLGFGKKLKELAALPDEAWRTHLNDEDDDDADGGSRPARSVDLESGDADLSQWRDAVSNKNK